MIGIYLIENIINNKKYVGQSVNIKKRFSQHKSCNAKHGILVRAFKKYGIENFKFSIIEECEEKYLSERESFWINEFNSFSPNGYNLIFGDIHGRRSELTKSKVSLMMKKRHQDGEYRKKSILNIERIAKDQDVNNKRRQSLMDFYKTDEGKRIMKKAGDARDALNDRSGIQALLKLCKDPEFIKKRSIARMSKVIYVVKRISDGFVMEATINEIVNSIMTKCDFSSIKSGKQKSAKGWIFLGEKK